MNVKKPIYAIRAWLGNLGKVSICVDGGFADGGFVDGGSQKVKLKEAANMNEQLAQNKTQSLREVENMPDHQFNKLADRIKQATYGKRQAAKPGSKRKEK